MVALPFSVSAFAPSGQLKRSHAAGWLTEEEYNFELKKLLSSRSESVETTTLATNKATEDSSGKTKMFGCPYLHPMKVLLLSSLLRFALQGLCACTPSCDHLRCRDDFHVNHVAQVTRLGLFDVARTRCRYFWHRMTSGGAIGATRDNKSSLTKSVSVLVALRRRSCSSKFVTIAR